VLLVAGEAEGLHAKGRGLLCAVALGARRQHVAVDRRVIQVRKVAQPDPRVRLRAFAQRTHGGGQSGSTSSVYGWIGQGTQSRPDRVAVRVRFTDGLARVRRVAQPDPRVWSRAIAQRTRAAAAKGVKCMEGSRGYAMHVCDRGVRKRDESCSQDRQEVPTMLARLTVQRSLHRCGTIFVLSRSVVYTSCHVVMYTSR
jgi:hypothetical protein